MEWVEQISGSDKVRILRQLRAGKKVGAIADKLGCRRQTVSAVMREAAIAWINGVEAQQRLREMIDRAET